jgi:hypothetical protein
MSPRAAIARASPAAPAALEEGDTGPAIHHSAPREPHTTHETADTDAGLYERSQRAATTYLHDITGSRARVPRVACTAPLGELGLSEREMASSFHKPPSKG